MISYIFVFISTYLLRLQLTVYGMYRHAPHGFSEQRNILLIYQRTIHFQSQISDTSNASVGSLQNVPPDDLNVIPMIHG